MRNLPAIFAGLCFGGVIALIAQSWGQGGPTTTPYMMGVPVSSCGTTPYTYTVALKQVPITVNLLGQICVNQ